MSKKNQWLFEVPPAFEITESNFESGDRDWEVGVKPSTVRLSTAQQTRSPALRRASLSLPLPARPLTYNDVRSDRIDVFAQRALLRMSKNIATRADATGMAAAVKSGKLGGIYKEDEKVPALRARKMNFGWWQIVPKGEDAVLFLDPVSPMTGSPIIVFRNSVRSLPQRLDPALLKAWKTYKLQQTGIQTGKVQQCGQITPSGVVMTSAFTESPISNLTPPILCFTGTTSGTNGTTCICDPRRNVCPDCECKMADNCNLKCPSKSIVKRLSFQEMWDLIIRYYYCELPKECKCGPCCQSPKQLRDIFSPELLIAIFWEETGFRNIPQLPCGPAVGFGQVQGLVQEGVQPVSAIWLACQFCGIPTWSAQEISCDDAKAVKISGMLLWRLYCLGSRTKNGALIHYAGGGRQNIVNGWLACEDRLRNSPRSKSDFVEALNLAAPNQNLQPTEEKCVFPGNQAPNLHRTCM